jgi:hypothetical protein
MCCHRTATAITQTRGLRNRVDALCRSILPPEGKCTADTADIECKALNAAVLPEYGDYNYHALLSSLTVVGALGLVLANHLPPLSLTTEEASAPFDNCHRS